MSLIISLLTVILVLTTTYSQTFLPLTAKCQTANVICINMHTQTVMKRAQTIGAFSIESPQHHQVCGVSHGPLVQVVLLHLQPVTFPWFICALQTHVQYSNIVRLLYVVLRQSAPAFEVHSCAKQYSNLI